MSQIMFVVPSETPLSGREPALPVWLRHTVQPAVTPPVAGKPRDPDAGKDSPYAVRVMDNPVNTYQQVMEVCSTALGISFEEAYGIASTIDSQGSCVVCVAPRPEAERVAAHIGSIGIEVRLERAGGPTTGP
jgi:ATP-dependent Clp protease adapter protein ClpS